MSLRVLAGAGGRNAQDPWTLAALTAGSLYVTVLAVWPAVGHHIPKMCLMTWFGGHCPGCGLTRACAAILRLDGVAAFQYNPLVIFVAPWLGLRFIEALIGSFLSRPIKVVWPRWLRRAWEAAFLTCFVVVTVMRLVSWVSPAANPLRLGLPVDVAG
jgi:hypothetical protein